MKPLEEPRCGMCGLPRDHDRHRTALRIDAHEFVPPIPPCEHRFDTVVAWEAPPLFLYDPHASALWANVGDQRGLRLELRAVQLACSRGCGALLSVNHKPAQQEGDIG